jgi:hypothetical protein
MCHRLMKEQIPCQYLAGSVTYCQINGYGHMSDGRRAQICQLDRAEVTAFQVRNGTGADRVDQRSSGLRAVKLRSSK